MKKNKIKSLIYITLFGATAMLTSCSKEDLNLDELNNNITQSCNQNNLVDENREIKKFSMFGADIQKNGFDFDVYFNGLSSLTDSTIGYTSVLYSVPSSNFADLDSNSSRSEVYKVLGDIAKEYSAQSVSITPVNDYTKVNTVFSKNEPRVIENYQNYDNILLNISAPQFNEESKTVSVDTLNLVYISQTKLDSSVGLGIGFSSGDPGLGLGVAFRGTTGSLMVSDTYTLQATNEEFEEMKNDPSKVLDYMTREIENKNADKILAKRNNITSVNYDSALKDKVRDSEGILNSLE